MKKVPLAFLVHNSSLSGMSYSMMHRALYSLSWLTDIHNRDSDWNYRNSVTWLYTRARYLVFPNYIAEHNIQIAKMATIDEMVGIRVRNFQGTARTYTQAHTHLADT